MKYLWIISTYILLIVPSVACQFMSPSLENIEPQSTAAQPSTFVIPLEDTTMTSPSTPEAAAQKMVELAKKYLAQRLGISVEQITFLEAKPVVWQDASLGCPRPAIDYIRAETPGYNIAFEVDGKTYNVHSDTANRVVMCNKP